MPLGHTSAASLPHMSPDSPPSTPRHSMHSSSSSFSSYPSSPSSSSAPTSSIHSSSARNSRVYGLKDDSIIGFADDGRCFYVSTVQVQEDPGGGVPSTIPRLEISNSEKESSRTHNLQISNHILRSLEPDSVSIIVSILSGTGQAEKCLHDLVKPFLSTLVPLQSESIHLTTSRDFITNITRSTFLERANKGQKQLIVLLSGDGGVSDVLNGLASAPRSAAFTPPAISLIPMGTGNAIANSSTSICSDATLGLSTLARGSTHALPMFQAKFSPGARLLVDEARREEPLWANEQGENVLFGAVVCSWGLHASLVADSDTTKYRKHGAKRFRMAAQEALFPADGSPPHEYAGRLSLRKAGESSWQQVHRSSHAYVLVTLASQLEKGFTISPASKSFDGQLRVVHFGPRSGHEITRLLGMAYLGGKHIEDPDVDYNPVDGIRIDFNEKDARWRRVCIDGKIVRVEEGGWVEVNRTDAVVLNILDGPLSV